MRRLWRLVAVVALAAAGTVSVPAARVHVERVRDALSSADLAAAVSFPGAALLRLDSTDRPEGATRGERIVSLLLLALFAAAAFAAASRSWRRASLDRPLAERGPRRARRLGRSPPNALRLV